MTTPALQVTVVKNGAGMVTSGSNFNGRPARTEIDKLWLGGEGFDVSSITHLAIIIFPPTHERSIVEDGASVHMSSSHRNSRSTRRKVD